MYCGILSVLSADFKMFYKNNLLRYRKSKDIEHDNRNLGEGYKTRLEKPKPYIHCTGDR